MNRIQVIKKLLNITFRIEVILGYRDWGLVDECVKEIDILGKQQHLPVSDEFLKEMSDLSYRLAHAKKEHCWRRVKMVKKATQELVLGFYKDCCKWGYNEIDGAEWWKTSCGYIYCTDINRPTAENGMNYCPYCGKKIEEVFPDTDLKEDK